MKEENFWKTLVTPNRIYILYLTIGIILILAGLYYLFPQFDKVFNMIIAFANICLVVITYSSLRYARLSNERAAKVFAGQNKPLIDVTPIALGQSPKGTHVTTMLSINNYSGFKAYNIGFDIKYGERGWHGEWLKASEQSGGVKLGVPYDLLPKAKIPLLESGETGKEEIRIEGEYVWSSGVLNLEKDICESEKGEIPIQIRVRWENENHHIFDEVHEYNLICTKAGKNDGRSFAFIPVGVVSQKG